MKKYLLIIAIAGLSSCSTVSNLFPDYPKQVAVLQASLAAAEHTALIYVNLPVCGKTASVICRSPQITAKIGQADNIAFNAVEAARQAEDQTSLGAAQTAVDALQSITNNLPTGAN